MPRHMSQLPMLPHRMYIRVKVTGNLSHVCTSTRDLAFKNLFHKTTGILTSMFVLTSGRKKVWLFLTHKWNAKPMCRKMNEPGHPINWECPENTRLVANGKF